MKFTRISQNLLWRSKSTTSKEFGKKCHYDVEVLLEAAGKTNSTCLPDWVADYTGPVECVSLKGKGKGLIATKPIEPGQLILASRAFTVVFSYDCRSYAPIFDWNPEGLGDAVKSLLVNQVVDKVTADSRRLKDLYELWPRPEQPEVQLKLDRRRIQSIIDFNTFGNADEPRSAAEKNDGNSRFVHLFDLQGGGLWLFPSFLNHSCTRNTSLVFLGDFMLVRAAQLINVGQEVTISYCPVNTLSELERRKKLEKFGFICVCPLCLHDRKFRDENPVRVKSRDRIYRNFNRAAHGRNLNLTQLEEMLITFEQLCTYQDRYDHYWTNMLETVGFLHLKSESLDLAIDKFTKSHQNRTGFNKGEDFISDSISLQYIHNVLTLARVNHVKKDPKAVRFWGLIAREYLQRTCGMSKLTLIDPSYQPIELIIDSGDN